MKYELITILKKDNESIIKEDYLNSQIKFSGDFALIEEIKSDYSSLVVVNLSEVDKIRVYNKIKK